MHLRIIQRTSFFVTKANSNDWIWPRWYNTDKKKGVTYTDTLLIYTLWCEFSNDSDAQSDFGKNFVKKKAGPLKPFLSKIEYLAVAFIESDTVYFLW